MSATSDIMLAQIARDRNPSSDSWAAFIARQLERRDMTRRELARLAGIDASYPTYFLRGYVPRHTIVRKIGRALGCLHEALDAAGLKGPMDTTGASIATRDLFERLRHLPPAEQDQLTAQLRAYLDRNSPFFYPAG